MPEPRHVYEIFVKASPERVWQAITDPAYTRRYFHGTDVDSTFEPGAGVRYVTADGTTAVEGEVEVAETWRRLVLTWHALYDAEIASEPPSRVEWELTPADDAGAVTRVTLRHGDLALSPRTWSSVRLGWVAVLDGLKTLLETGHPLGPVELADAEIDDVDGEWHRSLGVAANNSVWELLELDERSAEQDEEMLRRAYAAAYHWARAARREPVNDARATWLQSRVWAALGHGDLALRYADRCVDVCAEHALVDFDLAYAHEARARALACLGRFDEAAAERSLASAVPIAGEEDRKIFESDLASQPWFGLPVGAVG